MVTGSGLDSGRSTSLVGVKVVWVGREAHDLKVDRSDRPRVGQARAIV
jgi:hypothetical protein